MKGYDKNTDYFKTWVDNKHSILNTMIKNMAFEIRAGYNYFGENIKNQIKEIEDYRRQMDAQLMDMAEFTSEEANKWCFLDLIRRGAIEY